MGEEMQMAAAYIRVSTEDQTEFSPEAQLREIQRYAIANHMFLLPEHVYIDAGISGRSASKRPAFQAMIAAAKQPTHPFSWILVHKFDRFARSREDSIVYKSLLSRVGVRVVSVTESFDDGGSGIGMLLESITEAYAEFYSVNLGREVKKGMTEKAMRGGLQTSPAYGYRVVQNELVPNPPEDTFVQQLFQRYVGGACIATLAKWMNAQGQRTHRGNPFENRTISYILRNPVYIGKLRWNPTGKSGRNFDDPNCIVVQSAHPPLVTQSLFVQAQQRLARTKAIWTYHKKPSSQRHHWLCGIVRCASCGATLVWSAPHYFKCNHYVHGSCPDSQHVHVGLLEAAFISRLRNDAACAAKIVFQQRRLSHVIHTEADIIQQEMQSVERKLSRIREAYQAGVDTLKEYSEMKARLYAQQLSLQKKLASAAASSVPMDVQAERQTKMYCLLHCLEDETTTIGQKYEAVAALTSCVLWNRAASTLSVTYRMELTS